MVNGFIQERWASIRMISMGRMLYPGDLPGFAAFQQEKLVGLVTYRIGNNECEVVTIDSLAEEKGIGSSLLNIVRDVALKARCKRLWLITTNDNLRALRFHQKWGLRIRAVYPNALEQSRKLKPRNSDDRKRRDSA